MSSHREAPAISKDPAADNTDLYAFVDPVDPTKVTILSNFIPLEEPAGGPNFFQFGDDVLYEILIDNNGDGVEDVTYQFRFKTAIGMPDTFLYNEGQILSASDPWNLQQKYSVTRVRGPRRSGKSTVLGTDLLSPPARIGPRSTPNEAPAKSYESIVADTIHALGNGVTVFAGQRGEGFYVDLGSIFDLGALRPFNPAHLIPRTDTTPKNGTKGFNVHTIAIRVPMTELTRDGSNPLDYPDGSLDPRAVIGVWSAASRQRGMVRNPEGADQSSGPWVQVSRLGNPLINEVVIPLKVKDLWNKKYPSGDLQFVPYYEHPRLQVLLPVLYPDVFPALAALTASGAARADLVAILLTGIPAGLSPLPADFTTFTGTTPADALRLNLAIPPSYTDASAIGADSAKRFGLLRAFVDGVFDVDGFPNGRRVFDNVTAIELRAVAGLTYQLVASYTPDGAAGALTDGTTNDVPYLSTFPYLATPHEGYEHSHD